MGSRSKYLDERGKRSTWRGKSYNKQEHPHPPKFLICPPRRRKRRRMTKNRNQRLAELTGMSKGQRRLLTLAGKQNTVDRRKGHEALFDGLVRLGFLSSAGEITQAGRNTLETMKDVK